jgi:hypothetical protein
MPTCLLSIAGPAAVRLVVTAQLLLTGSGVFRQDAAAVGQSVFECLVKGAQGVSTLSN